MTPTAANRIPREHPDQLICGLISVSDRASSGVYQDQGIPALQNWLTQALAPLQDNPTEAAPVQFCTRLIADEQRTIEAALIELVDQIGCDLVLTTGGTGPALRDVTPEATLAVATKVMPGFGEQMRAISMHFVPTAILSRQVAVVRTSTHQNRQHSALIINLPGQPKSIQETLQGLKANASDPTQRAVPGIFAAVPYCIDLIGGPYVQTRSDVIQTFRPKNAMRAGAAQPVTKV